MRRVRFLPASISRSQLTGSALLLSAALLVGAAIVADGSIGRALNGAGALGWFAAIPLLVHAALRTTTPWTWFLCIGLSGTIAFLVRPSDIWQATVVFAVAGGCMGWVAMSRPVVWGALVAAFYLPAHIGAAVVKAALRELAGNSALVRTEPPPTAAIVPLVMVIVAMGSAWVISVWRESRSITSRDVAVRNGASEMR